MTKDPSLLEIADGVFAWIGVDGNSNAGAIRSPDGLIVIDAQQTSGLARQLRAAVTAVSGLPVCSLINTHCHLDHTAGNIEFSDVPIIAHERTTELLNETLGTRLGSFWTLTGFSPIARLLWGNNLLELVPEQDPQLEWFRSRVSGAEYETVKVLPPTVHFSEEYQIDMPDEAVNIIYRGPAHCDGDAFIFLKKRRVVFMGDLLFYGRFPWLGDCDLDGWITRLSEVLKLDIAVVVPGHGPVTDLKEVARFQQLLTDLRNAVQIAIQQGHTEEAAMSEIKLPQYEFLPRYREWIAINVKSVYRYLSARR